MTRDEIIAALSPIVPTAYGWADQEQEPDYPIAILHRLYSDHVVADNDIWHSRYRWQLDLEMRRRDGNLEARVEQALRDRGLLFSLEETQEGDDGYIRIVYRFTTLGADNNG